MKILKPDFIYYLALLFLLTQLLSCESSQEDYKIEPQKMVAVISDIHIAEVALQSVSVTLKDSLADVYYNQVFEIHGVNEEDFNHDINLIRSSSKALKSYYTKVLENLTQQEKEFVNGKKNKKPKTEN